MGTNYNDAVEYLTDALQNLSLAYDAASSSGDRDSIFSAMEILQDEINAVSAAGLSDSDSAYRILTDRFRESAKQLDDFKADIDKHVHDIAIAGNIADALLKVIGLLA